MLRGTLVSFQVECAARAHIPQHSAVGGVVLHVNVLPEPTFRSIPRSVGLYECM